VALESDTLQHTATHCNTLQHTATHCNTLQHTATHCNTLTPTRSGAVESAPRAHATDFRVSVLQCVAVCCNTLYSHIQCSLYSHSLCWSEVLQCVAVCCSVSDSRPICFIRAHATDSRVTFRAHSTATRRVGVVCCSVL